MATFAVGDVHGNAAALDDLLAVLLTKISSEDVLVFLGDYIDRGPDSRGVLERLVRLHQEAVFEVIFLLGNHEQWLLRSLDDPYRHDWLLGMEGLGTITSYDPRAAAAMRHAIGLAAPRLFTSRVRLPYETFFDAVPEAHIDFLRNLRTYHTSPDVICVHGGVDLAGLPPEFTDAETLIWGPAGFPEYYSGHDRVVYGHRNDALENWRGWPRPRIGRNGTYGIDTISSGVLTAMRFPDLQTYQSRRHLRSGPADSDGR